MSKTLLSTPGKSGRWTAKRISYIAVFIALAAVGANLKIPSIIGTPAFDSFPGFLGALILGPLDGALVAALGHMLTALTAGFPLTLPIHLLIAAGMAGIVALFSFTGRYNLWASVVVGILLNGVVFPAVFIPLPGFGKAFFVSMVVPLLVASILNIILSVIVFNFLRKIFSDNYIDGKEK